MIIGTPAGAVAAEKHRLTYAVYASGFHVVNADLDMTLGPKDYTVALAARTQGFLGKLAPWGGTYKSVGAVKGDQVRVRTHTATSTWRDEVDTTIHTYNGAGKVVRIQKTESGVDVSPKELDPTLTKGVTDLLSATLEMLRASGAQKTCTHNAQVFDGRRRFTLAFRDAGSVEVKQNRYGLFAGTAQKCTVEVTPNGGAWHKKPRGWLSIQEQGRKKGELPSLWLARVDPNLPPVPVRIVVKTDYGTMIMHLETIMPSAAQGKSPKKSP